VASHTTDTDSGVISERNTGLSLSSFLYGSVADPGSGAFLTTGSGILNRFFPDPGSQTHIFESLVTFLGKKFYNSLKFGPLFFLQQFKNKIILPDLITALQTDFLP